ncbi:Helicase C-terminal [Penicillium verhagenii]|uniref:Helicase C-terminal n=1 Tax=Penicillium verhagenii TaxID=1562060 RepID=UPI00254556C8|nr:Helicase C-terminal [Penicillium verhagenii]KAJ5924231.1 Helicase C-terminal [Penicillium verhagenii]
MSQQPIPTLNQLVLMKMAGSYVFLLKGRGAQQTWLTAADPLAKSADLQSMLDSLDPLDPATGTTIILSSYQAWDRRTTREVDIDGNPVNSTCYTGVPRATADPKARDPEAAEEEFDEDLLTDVEDEPILPTPGPSPVDSTLDDARDKLADLQDADVDSTNLSAIKTTTRRRFFLSLLRARLQCAICDEGHRIKTISSRQHQSVAKLSRNVTWFITATPMWNKPLDFCCYLSLLWTELIGSQCLHADQIQSSADVDEYRLWSAKAQLPETGLPYHLLCPSGLIALSKNGHLTSRAGFDCLPIILRLTCLCREPGSTMIGANGVSIEIGGDIPPIAILTVELRYTRTTQVRHDQAYHQIIEDLYEGAAEGEKPGETLVAMSWSAFRQLCHLAVKPKLDVFLRRSSSRVLSADINAFERSRESRYCGDRMREALNPG